MWVQGVVAIMAEELQSGHWCQVEMRNEKGRDREELYGL